MTDVAHNKKSRRQFGRPRCGLGKVVRDRDIGRLKYMLVGRDQWVVQHLKPTTKALVKMKNIYYQCTTTDFSANGGWTSDIVTEDGHVLEGVAISRHLLRVTKNNL